MRCEWCNEYLEEDEAIETDEDTIVCSDCADDQYNICECGRATDNSCGTCQICLDEGKVLSMMFPDGPDDGTEGFCD